MDSFESLVALLFEREGYWTKTSFKVKLEKEDKEKIGLKTAPRWELDILAYKAKDNSLHVIECKSFLDSPGVSMKGFVGNYEKVKNRYKLFNKPELWKVVRDRLVDSLVKEGLCAANPSVQLCLVAGNVNNKDREDIKNYFNKNNWLFFDDDWLFEHLEKLSTSGYENEAAAVVAKLCLRNAGCARRTKSGKEKFIMVRQAHPTRSKLETQN